jgi:hypothetical protein
MGMDSDRKTALRTGVLFIIATIAALAAAAVLPTLTGTGYLTGVANQPNQMAASALLYLIAAGTSVGIAISLYPLLKPINAALALGSVVFRTIEAVFCTAGVVSLLSLLTLGQQLATAPDANRVPIQALADYALNVHDRASLVAVIAFSLGGLMYYVVFYGSRLVPRWLSGWGIAGVILMMTACVLALFRNSEITGYTLLIVPIGLQEMVFAVWLLVKGFDRRFQGARQT